MKTIVSLAKDVFLTLVILFLAVSPKLLAQEQIIAWPYNPPQLPQGANPATIAAPRYDWFSRVHGNFERAKKMPAVDLIFDGDSITDNWQGPGKDVWKERYAKLNAMDFGIGGDRVEHVLWRLKSGQVEGLNPKLVVLMIGTNNTGNCSADQIAEGIKVLVEDYTKRLPNAHFLLLGVFPRSTNPADPIRTKIADINKKIESLGDGKHVTYLDIGAKFLEPDGTLSKEIMPDFLHPSAKGYQIWADAIQSEIDKYFSPTK